MKAKNIELVGENHMTNIFKSSLSNILDLFYPHLCLHCSSKLEKNHFYFCKICLNDFSYLEVRDNVSTYAVFENMGCIKTLLKEIKTQKILSITKITAAFIVVQHFRLKWPLPDVIYPMHNSLIKDHQYYLSKEVSLFLKRPMKKKQNLSKVALIVFDVLNIEKMNQIKEKLLFKKVYAIGLCFDVLFDDFDLLL
ncbi:MAG: hypothetical protein K940chlam5_00678 [Candidatus Anoxychlamydiales bacterium]|nr:hypothetical protein [Candidatus Anoxychlamydiales bacterium]